MELNELKSQLLYKFKSESELVNAINELSHNFTKAREKISDYLASEKLVSAYACFYFLTNLPKWEAVLEKIGIEQSFLADLEVVDIGSGPGTFIASNLMLNPDQAIIGIESSGLMRSQSELILKAVAPKRDIEIFKSATSVPKKIKKRLGVFGHSANEMGDSQVESVISKLELDYILFIEPGTKSFFKSINYLRTQLLAANYHIEYPCPSAGSCPILVDGDDWCHQFLYLKQTAEVQRLCQLAKKDRRLLPLSIFFFSRDKLTKASSSEIYRAVRVFKPTKFGYDFQLCYHKGKANSILNFQQLKRNLKKSEMKMVESILAGDAIKFKKLKDLKEDQIRGEIIL